MAGFTVQESKFLCPKCDGPGMAKVTEFSVNQASNPHRIEIFDHREGCGVTGTDIALQLGLCENSNHHTVRLRPALEPSLGGSGKELFCPACKQAYDV